MAYILAPWKFSVDTKMVIDQMWHIWKSMEQIYFFENVKSFLYAAQCK